MVSDIHANFIVNTGGARSIDVLELIGRIQKIVHERTALWMECEVRQAHDLGTHTLFIGEMVDAAINDDEKRPAAMTDTRMKYGGVRRGGH